MHANFDLKSLILPRVCGQAISFLMEDEVGDVHQIHQGEGGEQGDPLMLLLFSLAQHSALATAHERFNEGEHLFAFHDDLYTVCRLGTLSSKLQKKKLIQKHFHPKTFSSKNTFIQKHFHPKPFHPKEKTISSTTLSSKNMFIR